MDTRPDKKKYRGLISAAIISILATIVLIVGIICIIAGLVDKKHPEAGYVGIYVGCGCIVLSALMYLVTNIAGDIHWQSYLKEYYGEEEVKYHEQALRKLQNIENLLVMQQPQTPQFYPQTQYVPPQPQPQQQPQPESAKPFGQATRPQKRVHYFDSNETKKVQETSNEYGAQFKRPVQKKKEDSEQTEG